MASIEGCKEAGQCRMYTLWLINCAPSPSLFPDPLLNYGPTTPNPRSPARNEIQCVPPSPCPTPARFRINGILHSSANQARPVSILANSGGQARQRFIKSLKGPRPLTHSRRPNNRPHCRCLQNSNFNQKGQISAATGRHPEISRRECCRWWCSDEIPLAGTTSWKIIFT